MQVNLNTSVRWDVHQHFGPTEGSGLPCACALHGCSVPSGTALGPKTQQLQARALQQSSGRAQETSRPTPSFLIPETAACSLLAPEGVRKDDVSLLSWQPLVGFLCWLGVADLRSPLGTKNNLWLLIREKRVQMVPVNQFLP